MPVPADAGLNPNKEQYNVTVFIEYFHMLRVLIILLDYSFSSSCLLEQLWCARPTTSLCGVTTKKTTASIIRCLPANIKNLQVGKFL